MANVIARYDNREDVAVDRGIPDWMAIDEANWYNSRNYPGVVFMAVKWDAQGNVMELDQSAE